MFRGLVPPLGVRRVRLLSAAFMLVFFAGCAQLPRTGVVAGPTTAQPAAPAPQATATGSIFQAAYGRPLFEDQRPRQIGDTLIVVFNEKLAASKSSSARADRKGSSGFDAGLTPKIFGSKLGEQAFDLSGHDGFQGSGGADASNTFTGQMTVTVTNVLTNGNLQVAGEKRIGINQGTEYILFSGVVDPRKIVGSGTITSTEIADARLEYYGDGYIDEAQHMGWLQRLLLNISPF